MKGIINRIFGLIILLVVLYVFAHKIVYPLIKEIHNPILRTAVLIIFFVCCVIALFICIDIALGTHISEQIIAILVSNILWEALQFAGKLLFQGYKLSAQGITYGVKAIMKIFRS